MARRASLVRYQLFLERELSERFETLVRRGGVSKSSILEDALTRWLDRRAGSELEDRFGQRLDRMTLALGRVERDGQVLLESLALFIRYELMINAPLPEGDAAARAVGRDRFDAFVSRVAEAMAAGRRTLVPPGPGGAR